MSGESQRARPRRGIDYPRDLAQFEEFFPDEEACWTYLEQLRWRDGFQCPACGSRGEAWRASGKLLVCRACEHKTSVTAGTIFHGTRKPLKVWFRAVWEITAHKHGVSALGLKRVLGLKSYETAWAWMHKFRRAMVRPGRDKLSGTVEVDETYLGGVEEGVSGRETVKKAIVVIAVELEEVAGNDGTLKERIGRIRLGHVPDASKESLVPFLEEVVEPGSTIRTDGWAGYAGLEKKGFRHEVTKLTEEEQPAHVVFPSVHRVASLLKRWVLGTLQGGVAKEQLAYYLDEFTFRFNRRKSKARGLLFYRLLEHAVQVGHTSTAALSRDTGRGPRE